MKVHSEGNKKIMKDLRGVFFFSRINDKDLLLKTGDTDIDVLKFDKNQDHNDKTSMLFTNGFLPSITFST